MNRQSRFTLVSNTTWFGRNGHYTRCYMGFLALKGPERCYPTLPGSGDGTGRDGNGTGTGREPTESTRGAACILSIRSIRSIRSIQSIRPITALRALLPYYGPTGLITVLWPYYGPTGMSRGYTTPPYTTWRWCTGGWVYLGRPGTGLWAQRGSQGPGRARARGPGGPRVTVSSAVLARSPEPAVSRFHE